jgi:uncharacterized protein (TIGR02118 family)
VRDAVFVLHRDPDQPYADFAAAVRAARPAAPCVVNLAHETNALWAEHVGVDARPSKIAGTVVQPGDARALDPAYAAVAARHDGYLVESVVQWDHLEGEATADVGVKQCALVGRLAPLDRDGFQRRYDGQHGPLARIQHPGCWRYTQRFVVDDLTPAAPPVDAFAELHFRTVADFQRRFYLNATAPDVVADDTSEFLERRTTFTVMVDEVRARS